jgi:hypothetical protein
LFLSTPALRFASNSRRARVSRTGRLAIQIAAMQTGGSGTAVLRHGVPGLAGSRQFTAVPGRPVVLRVKLAAATRRSIERNGFLELNVTVTLTDGTTLTGDFTALAARRAVALRRGSRRASRRP